MSTAESYRKIAAELRARAASEGGTTAAELDHLALCYLRLADQADRNQAIDIAVEFGPKNRLDGDGNPFSDS
jgi:hypothetical protein